MFVRNKAISVILPNYNHGPYIERAVDAILAQDLPPCEIVIVDDGSTDDSLAIINKLSRSSQLIRVICNPTNAGLVPAQTRGLAIANGQYIYLAAADDFIFPGFFSLAVAMLEEHPEAGLFTGDSILLDGISNRFTGVRPIVMPSFRSSYISPSRVLKALATSDNWILTGASVIRADAIKALGGLDNDLGSFADGLLTRKIALTRGFCYAPRFVYAWSIIQTSASRVVALDADRATKLRDLARNRISADPTFPVWYANRFVDRWQFATLRLVLQQKQLDLKHITSFGAKNRIDQHVRTLIFAILNGRVARIVLTAWLFMWFRPYRLIDLANTFIFRVMTRYSTKARQRIDQFLARTACDTTSLKT